MDIQHVDIIKQAKQVRTVVFHKLGNLGTALANVISAVAMKAAETI